MSNNKDTNNFEKDLRERYPHFFSNTTLANAPRKQKKKDKYFGESSDDDTSKKLFEHESPVEDDNRIPPPLPRSMKEKPTRSFEFGSTGAKLTTSTKPPNPRRFDDDYTSSASEKEISLSEDLKKKEISLLKELKKKEELTRTHRLLPSDPAHGSGQTPSENAFRLQADPPVWARNIPRSSSSSTKSAYQNSLEDHPEWYTSSNYGRLTESHDGMSDVVSSVSMKSRQDARSYAESTPGTQTWRLPQSSAASMGDREDARSRAESSVMGSRQSATSYAQSRASTALRSPQRDQKSPKRDQKSPQQREQTKSPQRDQKSPQRGQKSPQSGRDSTERGKKSPAPKNPHQRNKRR